MKFVNRLVKPFLDNLKHLPTVILLCFAYLPVTIVISTLLWDKIVSDFFPGEALLGVIPGNLNQDKPILLGCIVWSLVLVSADLLRSHSTQFDVKRMLKFWGVNLMIYLMGLVVAALIAFLMSLFSAILLIPLWDVLIPSFFDTGVKIGFWLSAISYNQALELISSLILFPLWARMVKVLIKSFENDLPII